MKKATSRYELKYHGDGTFTCVYYPINGGERIIDIPTIYKGDTIILRTSFDLDKHNNTIININVND